ncbi:MAG: DNA polymerase III subunit gamma/tau [Candidatus Magasanikbacteria bacterium]|nr:DNA polymerase III subunit gamma/tau [Candidatus Magasanikbacteria bacterium]
MSSLYRRHRPQKWESISGQNTIKRTLEQEIKDAHLAHAYLFAGPRGVGKTSIARIVAKAVNCAARASGSSEPCNTCATCEEITAGRALDVLEIDAASHTGVDNVRETIIENARFAPSRGKYKVFIIDEVHMLSISAFNALLKIIEEPPAHVIFILATTELDKVPETIISRCQRFDFKKIPHLEIIARLKYVAEEEKITVEDEVYERVARQSEGCARDAESLLDQLFSLGESTITSEMTDLVLPRFHTDKLAAFVNALIKHDVAANLNLVQTLAADGVDLMLFHDQLIEFLRFVMLAKFNPELARESFHLNDAALKSVENLAGLITPEQLSRLLEEVVNAKKWWKNARIMEIPLELFILKMASSNISPDPHMSIAQQATAPSSAVLKQSKPSSTAFDHTAPLQNISPVQVLPTNALAAAPAAQRKAESAQKMPSPSRASDRSAPNLVSLDEIKKKWNDLLKRVQTYHHSLPVILRMSEPIEVVGNVLRIGLKYTFHRDKIKERRMSDLVEKALMDVLGIPLLIEPMMIPVMSDLTPAKEHAQGIEFEDLVQTFGGAPGVAI